jgi:putative sigma-54 modulation protein
VNNINPLKQIKDRSGIKKKRRTNIMNTNIQSVHFDADKKLILHIHEKVDKLKTFHEAIISSHVILRIEKDNNNNNKIAEIRLTTPGQELFAKKQCATFEEAVDKACDAIKTQIIKHKEKHILVK